MKPAAKYVAVFVVGLGAGCIAGALFAPLRFQFHPAVTSVPALYRVDTVTGAAWLAIVNQPWKKIPEDVPQFDPKAYGDKPLPE